MNTTAVDCAQEDNSFINSLMEATLGQRQTSLQFKIPFGAIYSLILLLGVSGNLCTCLVIARTKCLHTVTNLYLFSLAVSDLSLLLTGIPHELYSILVTQYPWYLNSELCRLRNFLAELTPTVSILTITCFTVERYIAIAHPLRAQVISSFKRTFFIILSIWLIGGLVCVPVGLASAPAPYVSYPNLSASGHAALGCPEPAWANLTGQPIPLSVVCNCAQCDTHIRVSGLLFFVVPVCVIAVLYLLIAVALQRSNPMSGRGVRGAGNEDVRSSHQAGRSSAMRDRDRRSKNSVVRMLVVIVVTFFICWAPFHLQRLLATYGRLQYLPPPITNALYFCSGSLYYVSSTLNPIFYNLMSAKFRQGFRSVFCGGGSRGHGGVNAGGQRRRFDATTGVAMTTRSDCRINGLSPSPSGFGGGGAGGPPSRSPSACGLAGGWRSMDGGPSAKEAVPLMSPPLLSLPAESRM